MEDKTKKPSTEMMFKVSKECKGSRRYSNESQTGKEPITDVYIMRSWQGTMPDRIKIVIESA